MTVVVVNGNIMGVHDVYMHEIQVGVQSIHVGDTCRSRNVLGTSTRSSYSYLPHDVTRVDA